VRPVECPGWSLCSEGTSWPISLSEVIVGLVVGLLLVIMNKFVKARRFPTSEDAALYNKLLVTSSVDPSVDLQAQLLSEKEEVLNVPLVQLESMEGRLKKGKQYRFFVFSGTGQLLYFKDEESFQHGHPPLGAIRLREIQVEHQENTGLFELKESTSFRDHRNYNLEAKDSETSSKWIHAIHARKHLGITNSLTFSFEKLGLNLNGSGRTVMQGVSGSISPGRMTAIMGPSGCGKSTFMTTLAGRAYYGTTSGTILVNGEKTPLSRCKKLVGFVPQEDVMLRQVCMSMKTCPCTSVCI
jgi:ABC-type multidrug transport system fused ATPase/permease subunit